MRRLLLIAAALVAATLVATGVRASGAAEPRVGFVAYSGSVPTPHTLDGMAFVGFLRAGRTLPLLLAAEADGAAGVAHLERAEDPELQLSPRLL